MTKRRLLGVLLFVLAALMPFFLWMNRNVAYPSRFPFDAAKWRAGDGYERGRMATSLWDGKMLEGKTRKEVVELLGAPDETASDRTAAYAFYLSGSTWLDWKEWLYVSFDESGKVAQVEVRD